MKTLKIYMGENLSIFPPKGTKCITLHFDNEEEFYNFLLDQNWETTEKTALLFAFCGLERVVTRICGVIVVELK